MKSNTTTTKIDDLRNLPDNKKCFDCHEKVPLFNSIYRALPMLCWTSESSCAAFVPAFTGR